tara:strand:- start:4306 stop:5664 length:1359 start_codon:yes stop_codon:yes gene_type:complete
MAKRWSGARREFPEPQFSGSVSGVCGLAVAMPNTFYGAFDVETLKDRPPGKGEFRTQFQIDRDRIIHTSAFRSLQSKTQVFLSGEYDFYRTRLTHSIEVAQIGRSICARLNHESEALREDYQIDPALVEAVCLSHDIGHPPFGHCGERTLNRLMRPYGGFEGNAQTLRLLTRTIFDDRGMVPSRGFLDGVLKYKTLFSELENPVNHFVYDEQAEYLDFAMGGRDFPPELTPGKPRDAFRSIECQIMDWADDTAYSLHDVADGIAAKFISIERLERWAEAQEDQAKVAPVVEGILKNIRDEKIEGRTGQRIGMHIAACSLADDVNFMSPSSNRYRYRLEIDPQILSECKIYKRIAFDLVFRSQQLQQLDRKAEHILSRLFAAFAEYYIEPESRRADHMHLLSPKEEAAIWKVESRRERARLVCDVIAKMTDGLATRTYKRLFDADFGSIVDLV